MKYDWKQGIKRLYIVCATIWYCFFTFALFQELSDLTASDLSEPFLYGVLISILAGPIALYYTARWIYQGFASEKTSL